MRWLDSITDSMDMSLSKLEERVEDRKARHVGVHGVTKNETQLSDWTTAMLLTELSLLAREGLFDCFNWSGNIWQWSVWSVLCHKTACSDLVIHKESGTTLNSSPSALRKPITIVYESLILCFLVVSFNFLTSPYALAPVSCSERLNCIFSFWGVITRAFAYWNILCMHDILRNLMEAYLSCSKIQNPGLYWNSSSLYEWCLEGLLIGVLSSSVFLLS